MSRSMHERLKFTSGKDRELFCDLATPSDVRELVGIIERQAERIAELEEAQKTVMREIIDSGKELAAARANLDRAHESIAEYERKLSRALADNNALDETLDAALAEVERLREENDKLKNKMQFASMIGQAMSGQSR